MPKKKITDKETLGFKIKGFIKGIKFNMLDSLTNIRRKLIRKEKVGRKKYLKVLGIRLPYDTHIEYENGQGKKYISILGAEICYKKTDAPIYKEANNINTDFVYTENPTTFNFRLEAAGAITPQMKRIHCEQKAYKQLEADGFIYSIKGKGNFVAPVAKEDNGERIKELYDALEASAKELMFLGQSCDEINAFLEKIYSDKTGKE